VDLGASFGVLSVDQQGGANSAAVDQVEQRFGATVAPFDIDAINRDASEASRAKRAPAFVWIAKSHHRRRGRQDDRRIAMRGYRGTDHLKQLVVLCPLGDNIPTAAPEHTVCVGNCLVRPLQMHHAITADDVIERLLFVGQVFRITLPELNIRMVRLGKFQSCFVRVGVLDGWMANDGWAAGKGGHGERLAGVAGHLLVDRSNPDRAGILNRWRRLVSDHLSLIIFPEGTRSADGRVGRFRGGSFLLALEAGLTIVPISISGTIHVMKKGRLMTRPGEPTLVVHEPVPAPTIENPSIADARELAARIEGIVRAGVEPIVDAGRRTLNDRRSRI
jgi:hypothetical protein